MAIQLTPIPPQLAEMGVQELALIMRNYDGEKDVLDLEIAILTEHAISTKQGRDIATLAGKLTEPMCEALSMTIKQFMAGNDTTAIISCGLYADTKSGE